MTVREGPWRFQISTQIQGEMSAEKGQRKKGKERHKDKGKEKEKANTAEQSSGSDSEEEQSHIALEHVHISKPLAKRIQAYLVSEPDKTKTTIIIDSGATSHMVPHRSWFEPGTYHVLHPPRTI
ncbi:hypothetical protein SERLA73DRAFT_80987, partial [Serpula lacrymans var. lacrymans S7.3]